MGICITTPQNVYIPNDNQVIVEVHTEQQHVKEHWPMNWIPPKECRLDKYIYDKLDETN